MGMLSKKKVVAETGLSSATIHRRIHAGDFPAPLQLTPNRIAWTEESIEEWKKSRPRGPAVLTENLKKGPGLRWKNGRGKKKNKQNPAETSQ